MHQTSRQKSESRHFDKRSFLRRDVSELIERAARERCAADESRLNAAVPAAVAANTHPAEWEKAQGDQSVRFWRENTLKLFGHVAQKPCSTPTFNRGCWGVARRGEWGRGMRAAFRKSFQNPWQQGRKIFFAREIGRQTTRLVLILPVQFELLRPFGRVSGLL